MDHLKIKYPLRLDSTALEYVGTPYSFGHSSVAGLDNLGLIIAVLRDYLGVDLQPHRPLMPVWDETTRGEPYLNFLNSCEYLEPICWQSARSGDILGFRNWQKVGGWVNHLAVKVGTYRVVHTHSSLRVRETNIRGWWERRLACAYTVKRRTT